MELQAPSLWQTIDFISDLHLQASEMKTLAAWQHYLQHTTADAVFMLGDLFEVWVGDDTVAIPDSFEQLCAQTLRSASDRLDVFILHGNRDFLMGPALMQVTGATLIPDPTVLSFAGQRWLLTHGDALCLADTAYLAFREQVRSQEWQFAFLAKPLAERQALARQMRAQSETRKQTTHEYADVDTDAALQWLTDANAATMIHGHTHRPNHHALDDRHSRWVLSDWELDHGPSRADVLRLDLTHPQPYRLDPLTLLPTTPG
jgi:UDP-2,3-diacylglucosamine hydrolase